MYVLNNEAQNTLKMPSVKKLIYKNQVDRKNIIGVLTAPAKNSRPKGRFFLAFWGC